MKHFEEQLKKVAHEMGRQKKIHPDTAWLKRTRLEMVNAINQSRKQIPVKKKFFIPLLTKPAALVSAALIIIFFIGSTSAWAAQAAYPGDMLYPVKRATEKVVLGMVVSPVKKAELYIMFTNRRLDELARMYSTKQNSEWEQSVMYNLEQYTTDMGTITEYTGSGDISASLALQFEHMTREQEDRMIYLRGLLTTSTAEMLEHQRTQHERHRVHALNALSSAQERLQKQLEQQDEVRDRVRDRIDILEKRIEQRFKLLEERNKQLHKQLPYRDVLNKELEEIIQEKQENTARNTKNNTSIKPHLFTQTVDSKNEGDNSNNADVKRYEDNYTDEGTTVENVIEIQGADDEKVEIIRNINNGQGTTHTTIDAHADGGTINIIQSSTINASSSQTIRFNRGNEN